MHLAGRACQHTHMHCVDIAVSLTASLQERAEQGDALGRCRAPREVPQPHHPCQWLRCALQQADPRPADGGDCKDLPLHHVNGPQVRRCSAAQCCGALLQRRAACFWLALPVLFDTPSVSVQAVGSVLLLSEGEFAAAPAWPGASCCRSAT